MDFGTKIRAMRAIRRRSQIELADITGVPNFTLSLIENGRMLPTENTERAIRIALDWTDEIDAHLNAIGELSAEPANGQ